MPPAGKPSAIGVPLGADGGTGTGASVALGLVLVQVLFGLHYVAGKVLLAEIPPLAWAPVRAAAAALLLGALALVAARRWPAPADLARLAGLSLPGIVINQWFFVEGLARTTPSHSAILNTTIPVWTLGFALVLRREPLRPARLLALPVALAGVLLVVAPWRTEGGGASVAGDLLTLVNALSYGLFLVLSKRVLARCDSLAATAVLMGAGTVGLTLVGGPALAAFDPAGLSTSAWWLGAFIVIGPTAGAYLLINWALARADSSQVAFFIFLQPVVAAVLSAAILGERIALSTLIGGLAVAVAVGVALGTRSTTATSPAVTRTGSSTSS